MVLRVLMSLLPPSAHPPPSPPAHRYDSSVQELNYTQRPGRLDDPNFQLKKCKKDVCLSWEGLPFWCVDLWGGREGWRAGECGGRGRGDHACRPGRLQAGVHGWPHPHRQHAACLVVCPARREVPIYCLPPCTGRRTNPVDMDGMTAVQVRFCLHR